MQTVRGHKRKFLGFELDFIGRMKKRATRYEFCSWLYFWKVLYNWHFLPCFGISADPFSSKPPYTTCVTVYIVAIQRDASRGWLPCAGQKFRYFFLLKWAIKLLYSFQCQSSVVVVQWNWYLERPPVLKDLAYIPDILFHMSFNLIEPTCSCQQSHHLTCLSRPH